MPSLSPFPSAGYESVNPSPTRGRCCYRSCRRLASVELVAAAGPEFGDLRWDSEQAVIARPFCGQHVALATRFASPRYAFGPAPVGAFERFARGDVEVPW